MGLFDLVNKLSVLQVGRVPQFKKFDLADLAGAPDTLTDGKAVDRAVVTQMVVALREEVHTKTSRISVTPDASSSYLILIDGNLVTVGGDADQDTLLNKIANDLNTDSTVGGIVTAVADTDNGYVEIKGDAEASYALDVATQSGSGTITIEHEDADSAQVRVFSRPDGLSGGLPQVWTLLSGVGQLSLGRRGGSFRLPTAGQRRIYPQIISTDGDLSVWIGPAVLEGEAG